MRNLIFHFDTLLVFARVLFLLFLGENAYRSCMRQERVGADTLLQKITEETQTHLIL